MKTYILIALSAFLLFSCTQESSDFASSSTLSGSYASMLVINDHLYAINESELTTFDIQNTEDPKELDKQNVGFDIENIFHNAGVLFIGSESALHIFEIGTDGIPLRRSETTYFFDQAVTSCDPVIANDNYAYVTLSTSQLSSGSCQRLISINELRIYDITDIEDPQLISVTPLDEPKGLTLVDNYLFVCEANIGLEVLDVSDPLNVVSFDRKTGFQSYDVIAKEGLLMVVGPTEIRQYDYTDINNIQYLSSIEL